MRCVVPDDGAGRSVPLAPAGCAARDRSTPGGPGLRAHPKTLSIPARHALLFAIAADNRPEAPRERQDRTGCSANFWREIWPRQDNLGHLETELPSVRWSYR